VEGLPAELESTGEAEPSAEAEPVGE
jgi:hypothetical protein